MIMEVHGKVVRIATSNYPFDLDELVANLEGESVGNEVLDSEASGDVMDFEAELYHLWLSDAEESSYYSNLEPEYEEPEEWDPNY